MRWLCRPEERIHANVHLFYSHVSIQVHPNWFLCLQLFSLSLSLSLSPMCINGFLSAHLPHEIHRHKLRVKSIHGKRSTQGGSGWNAFVRFTSRNLTAIGPTVIRWTDSTQLHHLFGLLSLHLLHLKVNLVTFKLLDFLSSLHHWNSLHSHLEWMKVYWSLRKDLLSLPQSVSPFSYLS